MFTRQHYVAIATIIKDVCLMGYGNPDTAEGAEIAQTQIGKDLADYFAADNSRFDRRKFLKACGLENQV